MIALSVVRWGYCAGANYESGYVSGAIPVRDVGGRVECGFCTWPLFQQPCSICGRYDHEGLLLESEFWCDTCTVSHVVSEPYISVEDGVVTSGPHDPAQ